LMEHKPMPVSVLSSLTEAGTQTALDAMAAGAVEVVCKPGSAYSVENLAPQLLRSIKTAARAVVRARPRPPEAVARTGKAPASAAAAGAPRASLSATTQKLIAIGASTGGVQALSELLPALPADAPGTLVVQHMPARFTASFATRLDAMCQVEVREARDGDTVVPGRVLIAPGGFHMLLRRSGARYYVEIKDGPEVQHQKPSVEVLFESVAHYAGANAVGSILTGMGADGAKGLLSMRRAGAHTVVQDEKSSIVFGMPMEAIRCGAAELVLPLQEIASALLRFARAAG
jgi:two-component system, chemotaxis family, protein-glutamate methylesterase/glutaminase